VFEEIPEMVDQVVATYFLLSFHNIVQQKAFKAPTKHIKVPIEYFEVPLKSLHERDTSSLSVLVVGMENYEQN